MLVLALLITGATAGVITDLAVISDKFRSFTGASLEARTDLAPSPLDLKIKTTSVRRAVEALTGEGYPFEPIGDPCAGLPDMDTPRLAG